MSAWITGVGIEGAAGCWGRQGRTASAWAEAGIRPEDDSVPWPVHTQGQLNSILRQSVPTAWLMVPAKPSAAWGCSLPTALPPPSPPPDSLPSPPVEGGSSLGSRACVLGAGSQVLLPSLLSSPPWSSDCSHETLCRVWLFWGLWHFFKEKKMLKTMAQHTKKKNSPICLRFALGKRIIKNTHGPCCYGLF